MLYTYFTPLRPNKKCVVQISSNHYVHAKVINAVSTAEAVVRRLETLPMYILLCSTFMIQLVFLLTFNSSVSPSSSTASSSHNPILHLPRPGHQLSTPSSIFTALPGPFLDSRESVSLSLGASADPSLFSCCMSHHTGLVFLLHSSGFARSQVSLPHSSLVFPVGSGG